MNIFVGNLPRDASEEELRKAFEAYGTIDTVAIIKDKFTGASRGFGFVEMSDQDAAQKAIAGLNGTDFNGRPLTINEARPKPERSRGGERRGGWEH